VQTRRKTRHFDYENTEENDQRTVIEKFEHEFFYTLVDVVIKSLTDRIELLNDHIN